MSCLLFCSVFEKLFQNLRGGKKEATAQKCLTNFYATLDCGIVDLEIFMRILFSWNSIKSHISDVKKLRLWQDFPISINNRVILPFCEGFIFTKRSFATIKSSRKFPNLQYSEVPVYGFKQRQQVPKCYEMAHKLYFIFRIRIQSPCNRWCVC